MAAICPPGFDCAYVNSCPSLTLDCPPGFFCSSYAGEKDEEDMDYGYALYKTAFNGDAEVTRNNADEYIDPDRAIQNACLQGFYCPNSTTIEPCPSGHWCPERTVEPQVCDPLSVCGDQAYFQVNFINPLIMTCLICLSLFYSVYLTRLQSRQNAKSGKKDPSARVASPLGDDSELHQHLAVEKVHSEDQDSNTGVFEVSFNNIECNFPGTNRLLLPNVSGNIPARRISAIMGPTASGKSTLMNIIRHGGATNCTTGTVVYSIRSSDGSQVQQLSAKEAQSYIGHVPQEDILDRHLTVRELLTFNAKARSRHIRTDAEVQMIVNEVLADLAIQHVADSIIGGGENSAANISGGQLKRVNIGCELVALSKPGLLLLDEPTAGLDAAIAYELILTLESLKSRGITICMVIQQPRAEIFERIDHLFLMNSVGGIVFEGHSSDAAPYLWKAGYAPNANAFDADFCLDVLNGLSDPNIHSSRKSGVSSHRKPSVEIATDRMKTSLFESVVTDPDSLDCTKLHLRWLAYQRQRQQLQYSASEENRPVISGDIEASSSNPTALSHNNANPTGTIVSGMGDYLPIKSGSSERNASDVSNSVKLSGVNWKSYVSKDSWIRFFFHARLNAERLITIRMRNRTSLLVYIFIDIIMALALSVGFTIYLSESYRGVFVPSIDQILQGYFPSALAKYSSRNVASMGFAQLLFFMSSALGSSSALSAVPVFSGQLQLVEREHASGISIASFAVGRIIGDTYFVLLHGFVFAGIWMLFGHAGHYYDWMAVILSTAFAASGMGYMASAAYKQSTASTWTIVAAFVSSVFAGVEPSLSQLSRYPVISWPWYLNFATWTAEATYFTWSRYLINDGHIPISLQDGADAYGYQINGENGINRSIGAMIALGVGMRIIAGYILYYRASAKRI